MFSHYQQAERRVKLDLDVGMRAMAVPTRRARKRSVVRRLLHAVVAMAIVFYGIVILSLVALRVVNPPTTALQMERHVQALIGHSAYKKSYAFVPLPDISPNLQHAVIAAEDARFYQHHGFDWKQVQIAIEDDTERGKRRGASTITQQLVKNLFLGTSRSVIYNGVRKGVEFTIVPLTEGLLSKQRILELYLNVIEWGQGTYGAEAASLHYYGVPAKRITREEAVELATVLPAPLRRKPGRMTEYGNQILERMAQMRW
jgi:monofunctional biosynthetic peptidoglycan transglycosylase